MIAKKTKRYVGELDSMLKLVKMINLAFVT